MAFASLTIRYSLLAGSLAGRPFPTTPARANLESLSLSRHYLSRYLEDKTRLTHAKSVPQFRPKACLGPCCLLDGAMFSRRFKYRWHELRIPPLPVDCLPLYRMRNPILEPRSPCFQLAHLATIASTPHTSRLSGDRRLKTAPSKTYCILEESHGVCSTVRGQADGRGKLAMTLRLCRWRCLWVAIEPRIMCG